ncbi:NAD(P)/FAD-dependent oxidoreductase [Pseudochelatococcus lubricantis]|uniref:NAD(P)/FAD-dependent oxidoreductase n=1 Tax=Pseudochelatococcus lubricantis TaxID=1538102 RepID=UPI0035E601A1
MSVPLIGVDTPNRLPETADVVVIGGGIIGVCTAYYLARRGISVCVLEKGLVGAEQSSRNWGWCRQQNRDARELPMAVRSLALWDALAEDIGESVGFRRCGLLYLSNDEEELDRWARWRDFAVTHDVETFMLDSAAATARGSATGRTWKGGVFSPHDGIADTARAAPVIARGVMKLGGHVVQGCAARGLERTAGRVSGVITEKGVIRTSTVVLAGGAWASSFCLQHGIDMPQATVRVPIVRLEPGGGALPPAMHTSTISLTERGDGGRTLAISGYAAVDPTPQALHYARHFIPMFVKNRRVLSLGSLQGWRAGHESRRLWRMDAPTPMEHTRILDPKPDGRAVATILERARRLLPPLADVPVGSTWAGYVDSTPDGIPVMSAVDALPGFYVAAGFSGHGFGLGTGAGAFMAELVTGSRTSEDPMQFRLDRFAAGRARPGDF